jgi:drug/metabolite transporter (DMT)-like permease
VRQAHDVAQGLGEELAGREVLLGALWATGARPFAAGLSVPVITALAAVVILGEPLRLNVVLGGAAIVGGLALALLRGDVSRA